MGNKLSKYIILLVFTFLSVSVFGQHKTMLKADYEFQQKNYTKAENLYKKALDNAGIEEKPDVLKKIAECNEFMNQYEKAIEYYEQYLIQSRDPAFEPTYHLGLLYLKTGQVIKAKNQFENLLLQKPDSKDLARMIASCDFANVELHKKNIPSVINQEAINSEQSEFGLAWLNDQLVFASKRLGSDFSSIHGRTNQGFSNIYTATLDPVYNLYNKPEELDGDINSQYNDGTFAFDPGTNTAYFTQCKKVPEKCLIYKGTYQDEEIVDVSVLTFANADYNFAHPSVSTDSKTIYFVSDMIGGHGGQDIWKANITNSGEIENVVNLGSDINTSMDEMFPYIYGDNILFFSSEGHVGMGGLDVFYTMLDQGVYSKPLNVGAPINSTSDDFSILLNKNGIGGVFCSNRDNEEKSDDIYSFSHNLFSTDIRGTVSDSLKLSPVAQAKIIYSTNSEVEQIIYTDDLGKFVLPLASHPNCTNNHELVVEKDGYITKHQKINCSYPGELLVLLNGGSQKNFLAGMVKDRNTDEPLNRVMLAISSVKGITDTIYSKPDGSWVSDRISPNDYYNVRASVDGYLSESKNILVPENIKGGTLSKENGFDTEFRLYPIELKKEFRIDNIYYEFDKAALLDQSKIELGNLVNILNENPTITIQINSHTDERGTLTYNQRLSNDRGRSVVNFLIHQGIDANRLFSKGYGETALVVNRAKTEEEHQLNRRTTFEIVGVAYNSDIINEGLEKEKELLSKYKIETEIEDTKPIAKVVAGNYGIQIHATSKQVDVGVEMKDISDLIEEYGLKMKQANGMYKYQLGPVGTREDATEIKKQLGSRGYGDCFLVVMEQ